MRYPASEKAEIIRLIEHSALPVNRTLEKLGIPRATFYRWYDLYQSGDELVIAEWDRATRSMWDGSQIIKSVIDTGAVIKVLDRSYIDLTTPMGRGFMAMMSAMAEDERLRIIKRTHEGRQIARAKGVKMGLTAYQIKEARQRIAKGEKTREVAKIFNVSISTISRLADAR
jgi:DNA invertase Pin-like site-specific DNA recombinase